jgi:hypothetical protein
VVSFSRHPGSSRQAAQWRLDSRHTTYLIAGRIFLVEVPWHIAKKPYIPPNPLFPEKPGSGVSHMSVCVDEWINWTANETQSEKLEQGLQLKFVDLLPIETVSR